MVMAGHRNPKRPEGRDANPSVSRSVRRIVSQERFAKELVIAGQLNSFDSFDSFDESLESLEGRPPRDPDLALVQSVRRAKYQQEQTRRLREAEDEVKHIEKKIDKAKGRQIQEELRGLIAQRHPVDGNLGKATKQRGQLPKTLAMESAALSINFNAPLSGQARADRYQQMSNNEPLWNFVRSCVRRIDQISQMTSNSPGITAPVGHEIREALRSITQSVITDFRPIINDKINSQLDQEDARRAVERFQQSLSNAQREWESKRDVCSEMEKFSKDMWSTFGQVTDRMAYIRNMPDGPARQDAMNELYRHVEGVFMINKPRLDRIRDMDLAAEKDPFSSNSAQIVLLQPVPELPRFPQSTPVQSDLELRSPSVPHSTHSSISSSARSSVHGSASASGGVYRHPNSRGDSHTSIHSMPSARHSGRMSVAHMSVGGVAPPRTPAPGPSSHGVFSPFLQQQQQQQQNHQHQNHQQQPSSIPRGRGMSTVHPHAMQSPLGGGSQLTLHSEPRISAEQRQREVDFFTKAHEGVYQAIHAVVSRFYDRPSPRAADIAFLKEQRLWNYLLACYGGLDDDQAESYVTIHLVRHDKMTSISRGCLLSRLILDYFVHRIWTPTAWHGFNPSMDQVLSQVERDITSENASSQTRMPAVERLSSMVRGLMDSPEYRRFYQSKVNIIVEEVKDLFKSIRDEDIDEDGHHKALENMAQMAWHLGGNVFASRMHFEYSFPDVGERFLTNTMMPIYPTDIEPSELQARHSRVALIVSPVITARDDREGNLSVHMINLADVICMP